MEIMPNIALVPVDGDLDVTTVRGLRRTLDALIDGGCRRIILNLAAVNFIDSAGMALILRAIRKMHSAGGLVSITNVSEGVLRALRIARVVDFAPISGAGPRRQVPELDSAATPLWRVAVGIDPYNLSLTRVRVEELLRRIPFSDDQMFDMMLAVGEAMGNAVDHADGSCAQVTVSAYRDRAIVDITDCGTSCHAHCCKELDAQTQAKSMFKDACCPETGQFSERGRGLKLMQLLADSVTISPKPSGVGTLVRIVKLVHEYPEHD